MRSTLATVLLLALVACQEKPATAGSTQVAPSGPAPAAATAPAGTAAAEVVASWTGGSLSYADASKDISISLLQMQGEYLSNRYDAEMNAVDEKGNKSVAEQEASLFGAGGGVLVQNAKVLVEPAPVATDAGKQMQQALMVRANEWREIDGT